MNPGAAKMQLSSFLGQMSKMIEMEMKSIATMQEVVDEATQDPDHFSSERLLALGAFIAWSMRDIDGAIGKSADLIDSMLRPLGLDGSIGEIFDIPFAPTPMESISSALEEAEARNTEALASIRDLEQTILSLSDKEIMDAYPENMIRDFQNSWNQQLDDLLEDE